MEDPQVLEVLLEEVDEELFQLERQKQPNADSCHSGKNDPVKAEIVEGTGAREFASVHHVHTPSTRGYTHATEDWKSADENWKPAAGNWKYAAERWKDAAEKWKSVAEDRKPVARAHTCVERRVNAHMSTLKPAPPSDTFDGNDDERAALQVWKTEIEKQLTLLSDLETARALALEDETEETDEGGPVPEVKPSRWIPADIWKILASIKRHLAIFRFMSWAHSKDLICACCSETYSNARKGLLAKCSHFYCNSCLISMVTISLKDGSFFPPQCCGQPITGSRMKKAIGVSLDNRLKEKAIEINDPDKTYCVDAKCGRYLVPRNSLLSKITQEKTSTCECGVRTCRACKSLAHTGICLHLLDDAFEELKVAMKWPKCYNCGRVVERISGCKDIT
ncbi:Zinc finger RING/FYVE/PHD-type [Penicillium brevicompactum]|uniref:Zinc finger RING/FYVE/PHD-type n=1 Tax=Penicillium brevicompactum TaxID=5074 RepID=UPI002540E2E2|nr:Zinc finger RING/FYVE/PHD-type [Penicillium brevicompactum]KAJ5333936.1 Zinc finger RING/FYVE/PHD-type [Penicillium brevicompactum]